MLARITDAPIDESAVRSAVEEAANGAVVLFSGVVRDHDAGRTVRSLDYEAHPEAERLLAACVAAVARETGVALAAVHRVGALRIGDVALTAAAASPHRAEAFAACALLVARIKTETPIWKRQHYADGVSAWVGLE